MNPKLTIGDYVGLSVEPKSNVKWSDDYCIVCGRKMGKNGFYVRLSIEGTILPLEFDNDNPFNQGCWNVGSECVKNFDAAVVSKA